MIVNVILFARLRELAGGAIELDLPAGSTVAHLRTALAAAHPALGPLLERSAIAVNHDFADPDRAIQRGDEVAVIPPVSGG